MVLALVGSVALGAGMLAAEPAQRGAADKARVRPAADAQVSGQVKSVDAKAGTITLTVRSRDAAGGADKTYTLAKDAKVTINGQAKTLADVTAGVRVTLKLSADNKVTEVTLQMRQR
jgi:hypothetical protein